MPWIRPILTLAILSTILADGPWSALAQEPNRLPLGGTWRFRRDDRKEGLDQRWYQGVLPAASDSPNSIPLPGTMDLAKAGLPNLKKPALDGPYRTNVYTGPAWYQRDVEIPSTWKGKSIHLFLERVRWVSQAWLDGNPVGQPQDSLVSPHQFDLGTDVTPGKHVLTLRVDNTIKVDLGIFVSALFGGTPTDMNGIVGRMELQATEPVAIDDIQVYPNLDTRNVRVRAKLRNASRQSGHGTVVACVTEADTHTRLVERRIEVQWTEQGGTVEMELPMGATVRPWDEFSPNLYELALALELAGGARDAHSVRFGMRSITTRETQLVLNGRPIFLRGTLECAVFPLTGCPPTEVAWWQRICRIIKSYGLNSLRFHSWCPPEAAFEAADLEGIIVQAEAPQANVQAGQVPARDEFTSAELLRMVRTYGNHPSFCLMTLGNEYGGKAEVLTSWIEMLRREDPRRLYSSASAAQKTPNRQFTVDPVRGVQGPGTDHDFRGRIGKEDRPLVSHEVGQWMFFPDFNEMKKYTGVLAPRNFEIVRDALAVKGMLDQAPQFCQACGAQAVLLYKEEIEVLLRTSRHAGFQLLDLHDYPTQGTALVGLLDPFWDSKGFVAPERHRRYCGATVPLVRLKKRTFTANEPLEATAELAHFGPQDLASVEPRWRLTDEQGRKVAAGSFASLSVPTGTLTSLGAIHASLAGVTAPCKLTLSVSLDKTPVVNDWEIWIYPNSAPATMPADVVVCREWSDARQAISAGRTVAFFPPTKKLAHALPGRFLPVFWSPVWFPKQIPNTMGILCDPKHPALAQFPTESYSNWQWWDLQNNSASVILDETPATFRPIVQVIDNIVRNHKLGNLFEARVGKGRLLVCTIDVTDHLEQRPAARQLRASLAAYLASDKFQPVGELTMDTLDKLFATTGR